METSIIYSGFGGQGALFAGQILADAAMMSGKEVTWIPSYGPEMRGGTAHCTVIVADESIASPLVRHPDCVVALNLPSADKYEPLVKSGGLLIVNSDLVTCMIKRSDIRTITIPGNTIAQNIGDVKLTNMVMLGALVAFTNVVALPAVQKSLQVHLSPQRQAMLKANYSALREGNDYAYASDPQPVDLNRLEQSI